MQHIGGIMGIKVNKYCDSYANYAFLSGPESHAFPRIEAWLPYPWRFFSSIATQTDRAAPFRCWLGRAGAAVTLGMVNLGSHGGVGAGPDWHGAAAAPAPSAYRAQPATYAALDLGTNNCRLLIARPAYEGFRIVDAFSRIVRLGEGLSKTGALCETAIARTIAALQICRDKMDARRVTRARLIATEACRAAVNGEKFVTQVQKETGLDLEIVDRETEAHLAAAGCASLADSRASGIVLFDIGGGSSEIVWLSCPEKGQRASLTTGVIVNAPSDKVITLRGLSINGACNGIRGINFISGKTLNVEDCVIFRFTNEGILMNDPTGATINVRNSVIRDNVGDGIGATSTGGQIKGTLMNSSFTGNGNGAHAKLNSRLTAEHCNFSGSTNNGVLADGSTGVIRISNSVMSNNGTNGVNASTGGVITINSCDIFNNLGTGALASGGGVVDTFQNNRIQANGTDLCATCTPKTPN